MQFINYFFASVISFLGLLIGILLIKIAPEEQKPLHKYFEFIRISILILIFLFLVFYYSSNPAYIIVLLFYLILIIFIELKLKNPLKKSAIICMALGIIFYLSSKNLNLFVIESSLILLYGIPTASLLYSKRENNHAKIFLYNLGFLLVANLAFFLRLPFLVSYF